MFMGLFAFTARLPRLLFKCGKIRISALRLPKHCRNICRNAETRTAQGSNKHALGRVGAGKKTVSAGQPGARSGSARQVQPAHVPVASALRSATGARLAGCRRSSTGAPSGRSSHFPACQPAPCSPALGSTRPARPGARCPVGFSRCPHENQPCPVASGCRRCPLPVDPVGIQGGGCTRTRSLVCISRAREDATVRPTLPLPPRPGPMGGMGLRRLGGVVTETGDSIRFRPMALFSIASALGRGLPRVRFRVWFG